MCSKRAKKPPPTMKFSGACSLNRNNSPEAKALKDAFDGRQKLTSSFSDRDERRNQTSFVSVMPT